MLDSNVELFGPCTPSLEQTGRRAQTYGTWTGGRNFSSAKAWNTCNRRFLLAVLACAKSWVQEIAPHRRNWRGHDFFCQTAALDVINGDGSTKICVASKFGSLSEVILHLSRMHSIDICFYLWLSVLGQSSKALSFPCELIQKWLHGGCSQREITIAQTPWSRQARRRRRSFLIWMLPHGLCIHLLFFNSLSIAVHGSPHTFSYSRHAFPFLWQLLSRAGVQAFGVESNVRKHRIAFLVWPWEALSLFCLGKLIHHLWHCHIQWSSSSSIEILLHGMDHRQGPLKAGRFGLGFIASSIRTLDFVTLLLA